MKRRSSPDLERRPERLAPLESTFPSWMREPGAPVRRPTRRASLLAGLGTLQTGNEGDRLPNERALRPTAVELAALAASASLSFSSPLVLAAALSPRYHERAASRNARQHRPGHRALLRWHPDQRLPVRRRLRFAPLQAELPVDSLLEHAEVESTGCSSSSTFDDLRKTERWYELRCVDALSTLDPLLLDADSPCAAGRRRLRHRRHPHDTILSHRVVLRHRRLRRPRTRPALSLVGRHLPALHGAPRDARPVALCLASLPRRQALALGPGLRHAPDARATRCARSPSSSRSLSSSRR